MSRPAPISGDRRRGPSKLYTRQGCPSTTIKTNEPLYWLSLSLAASDNPTESARRQTFRAIIKRPRADSICRSSTRRGGALANSSATAPPPFPRVLKLRELFCGHSQRITRLNRDERTKRNCCRSKDM
ncbi:hypothetical protein EVAR_36952_1 [Eumeta japonica]|uniref:Uncharacterized protein n=1 Tax=Eumeta variegata TaxID=151549 RepID=A0A4C1W9B5_EUMVA|nr:hypothetical protein EVAR_36952_1 [Eumeta japonica]